MPFMPYFNYYGTDRLHFGWIWLLILVLTWGLIWKGLALWRAARNGQKNWFIALLVINTMGVLEILYLSFFQRKPLAPKRRTRRKRQSK